jgi:hypothetical protein
MLGMNAAYGYVIGADIGGTRARVELFDLTMTSARGWSTRSTGSTSTTSLSLLGVYREQPPCPLHSFHFFHLLHSGSVA